MKYLLLSAVLLVGCAAPLKQINKDPAADYTIDYHKCEYEAMLLNPYRGFAGGMYQHDLIRFCLKAKGWQ